MAFAQNRQVHDRADLSAHHLDRLLYGQRPEVDAVNLNDVVSGQDSTSFTGTSVDGRDDAQRAVLGGVLGDFQANTNKLSVDGFVFSELLRRLIARAAVVQPDQSHADTQVNGIYASC